MTRLRHARALVRHAHTYAERAFGDRIPSPHHVAFRVTGVVTALAVAATTFTPLPASATTHDVRLTSAHASPPPAQTPRPAVAAPSAGESPADNVPFAPAQDPSAVASPLTRPPMSPDAEPATPAQEALPKKLPELPDLPASLRLEQRFAESALRGGGIRWRSTGGCSDRTIRTCTSFKGVRWGTVKGLIDFAESSGCKITVTGGTERGHAPGTYSHANGYKLDISPSRCVDAAIKRYPSTGTRGDGARLYRAPDGTVFAREKDHWDITFR
ncbi:hypothetical protein ABZ806_04390 [Spirillospora sp. NPDC047418]